MIDGYPQLPEINLAWPHGPTWEDLVTREWLVTNGISGYAGGTLAMCNTRRYHALFIPCLPEHGGRTVMLSHVTEEVTAGGVTTPLGAQEPHQGPADQRVVESLRSFRLRGLIPEWEFEVGGTRLLRRLVLVHGGNAAFLSYENRGPAEISLRLRPFPAFRPHDKLAEQPHEPIVTFRAGRFEFQGAESAAVLRVCAYASVEVPFICAPEQTGPLLLRVERSRGYGQQVFAASPGYFQCTLPPGGRLDLGMTTDGFEQLDGLSKQDVLRLELEREVHLLERAPESLRGGTAGRLTLAADQFIIEPTVRPADEAWAKATGQDARSVIAGYPWFTDWGRDTMISLEGLTLATGRVRTAAAILRTFRHYVRDGLIPNMFPEGSREGLYHTADATLWFFHAISRYLERTGDLELLKDFYPTLVEIIERHVAGTRFNIGVDAKDGLLTQGAEGYQLTWMDALVNGWVVTPRRGKAVEINALWFNALRLMADWSEEMGQPPDKYLQLAERVQASFNQRFWNPATGCLFDVVDGAGGDDPCMRPNQIFAISLRHPVLNRSHWASVLAGVEEQLLTPVGLRTLSPSDPGFKPKYDGDLRARDAAYHQGTVWPWLLGHFVDASLRVRGDPEGARRLLTGLESHLRDACIGQLSEIFDAEEPHHARGCVAQAWSVAEFLRAWAKTDAPARRVELPPREAAPVRAQR